jgi:hypothetical protein
MPHEETSIVGVFPHGKARARRAPRIHYFGVGPRAGSHPFKEIEDQVVEGVVHGISMRHFRGSSDFNGV